MTQTKVKQNPPQCKQRYSVSVHSGPSLTIIVDEWIVNLYFNAVVGNNRLHRPIMTALFEHNSINPPTVNDRIDD